jgi:hypothetical protein
MWQTDEACADEVGSQPSVTIFPDGWYRIERGGRVGVGPDAEAAIRDLEAQPVAPGATESSGKPPTGGRASGPRR